METPTMHDSYDEPRSLSVGLTQPVDADDGSPADADAQLPPVRPDPGQLATDDRELTDAAATDAPRRTLKLVLTLQPDEAPGYLALLALGADGCDPIFRSINVPTLDAALDSVVTLAAEAEARWLHRPRNPESAVRSPQPAATRRPSDGAEQAGTSAEAATSVASPAGPLADPDPGASPESLPAPPSKATGQLSLFG
jgi:hypothetical protein